MDPPIVDVGVILDPTYSARLKVATHGTARVRPLPGGTLRDLCDVLVVDPRLLADAEHASALRKQLSAQVPCVYYADGTAAALRAAVAARDVAATRLVLFGVDDNPTTWAEVLRLAPRDAHARRLLGKMAADLSKVLPHVRIALESVMQRPERYFDAGDVAAAGGLSRRHVDRVLARAALAPTKVWIVAARAWHAAFLLMHARCTAEVAASHLGYADAKALRRHLGAVWGFCASELASTVDDSALLERVVRLLHDPAREDES